MDQQRYWWGFPERYVFGKVWAASWTFCWAGDSSAFREQRDQSWWTHNAKPYRFGCRCEQTHRRTFMLQDGPQAEEKKLADRATRFKSCQSSGLKTSFRASFVSDEMDLRPTLNSQSPAERPGSSKTTCLSPSCRLAAALDTTP